MNILITGGLGQIGSLVAELLLSRGDNVCVVDNLSTGRKEHLEEQSNLEVYIESISNREKLEDIYKNFKPNIVVHAAASYKDPNDWYSDSLTNCVGGANIATLSKKYNVERIIYYQTALCYGLKPIENPITLTHPRNPAGSSYAISKTANELYIEESGLDFVTFRLANVIGPRNVAGPLPIFYKRLKEGKKCFVTKSRRDFVFGNDLAKATLLAIDGIGKGSYHFSSGKDVSIKELYDEVVKALDINPYPEPELKDLGPDDVDSILLDPQKTFKDFGNIEFTPLSEIVCKGVEYYKKYGTLGEYTHLKIEN